MKAQMTFKQEEIVTSNLKHKNIVGYHESISNANLLIIILEYCQGGDLNALIQNHRENSDPIPEDCIIAYCTQILQALQHAHQMKVIHRDIKPQNILLSDRDCIKVADFGVSKVLSQTGDYATAGAVGTWNYMSPEVV